MKVVRRNCEILIFQYPFVSKISRKYIKTNEITHIFYNYIFHKTITDEVF